MDDAVYVKAVLGGKVEAFGELVRKYQRVVVGSARVLLGNADEAEDLAQETFVKGYQHLRSLKDPRKFGPWLFTILRRVCVNHLERAPRHLPLEELAEVPQRDSNQAYLADVIDRLPLEYREVLTARYLHEMSYREIAYALGGTETQMRMRCLRARQAVKDELAKDEEEMKRLLAGVVVLFPFSADFSEKVARRVAALPPTTGAVPVKGVGALMAKIALVTVGGIIGLYTLAHVAQFFAQQRALRPSGPPVSSISATQDGANAYTLSNGVRVAFQAVGTYPADESPAWWGRDGKPVRPPAYLPGKITIPDEPNATFAHPIKLAYFSLENVAPRGFFEAFGFWREGTEDTVHFCSGGGWQMEGEVRPRRATFDYSLRLGIGQQMYYPGEAKPTIEPSETPKSENVDLWVGFVDGRKGRYPYAVITPDKPTAEFDTKAYGRTLHQTFRMTSVGRNTRIDLTGLPEQLEQYTELGLTSKLGLHPKLLEYASDGDGNTHQIYKIKLSAVREARYANFPCAWMLFKDIPLQPSE